MLSGVRVFGEPKYKGAGKAPSELQEQITLFNEIRRQWPELGAIALHVRNEGKKSVQAALREKAEGMVSGAADIIIPGAPAFVCELKKRDKGARVSKTQKTYLEAAAKNGAFCCICYGYESALEAIELWNATRTTCNG